MDDSSELNSNSIVVYTDGACSGNPGPGGWGAVIVISGLKVIEIGGYFPQTTNNEMELWAALSALKEIKNRLKNSSDTTRQILVFTDSFYVIQGITQWVFSWEKRGWKTAQGTSVAHSNLWKDLTSIHRLFKDEGLSVQWKHVRGHRGIPGNERADKIATSFAQNQNPNLYSGSLQGYPIPLTEALFSTPQSKPYYLSWSNGELKKHSQWKECEAHIKGQSQAKFKKISHPSEEIAFKKKWGIK